jgi:tetratricopeptide (TPR) repeat protein
MKRIIVILVIAAALGLVGVLVPWRSLAGPSDTALSRTWEDAQKAMQAHEYDLARDHLEKCLQASPFHAEAHFVLARACRLTGDLDPWLFHLRIAQFLGWPSEAINLEYRLGEAQSKNIWMVADELKDEVLQADPADKLLIIEALINGYLVNDDPKSAHRLALAWTMEYPDDWLGHLFVGRAYQLSMSFDKAIASFEKVLELKPDHAKARLWLGQTLVVATEFERALKHFQIYLQSHPGDPDALVGLAKCQFSLGDVEAARNTLDDLLRQDPKNVQALLARGQLMQSQAPEEALPWLRKAVEVEPNDPNIVYNLFLALRAAHKEEEADFYDRRLKEIRALTERLAPLQQQLLKDPNNVDLRFQIAGIFLKLGKEDEAAHWFQTVLWIDPDHRPTLRALADYWGKHDDARRAAYYAGRADGTLPRMSTP